MLLVTFWGHFLTLRIFHVLEPEICVFYYIFMKNYKVSERRRRLFRQKYPSPSGVKISLKFQKFEVSNAHNFLSKKHMHLLST